MFHPGPFAETSQRAEAVDFTEPIFLDHWGLVCPLQDGAQNVIFKPVESIWPVFMVTKMALCIVMGLADYIFFGFVNWDYVVGFKVRTFFNQGVERLQDSQLYQRFLIIGWLFPVFIFLQVYLGTMTAMLASSSVKKPIREKYSDRAVFFYLNI